jgi:hypothetical protein
MLWGGINIAGIVVAYLTVSPLHYVWKTEASRRIFILRTPSPPPPLWVETLMLGSALRLQFLLRLSWKIKTQLSRLITQYYRVRTRFFIRYVNLYILFCTIMLNYPLRSTMLEFRYATLWDVGEYIRGSVPYLSVPRYIHTYIYIDIYIYWKQNLRKYTLRFLTLSCRLWACDPN